LCGVVLLTIVGASGAARIRRPVSLSVPVIAGGATQGKVLTASTGSWSGSPTAYSYGWLDCGTSGSGCTKVAGATGSAYTLTSGDVGKTIRVAVTASNSRGATTAQSAPTNTVIAAAGSADTQPPTTPSGLAVGAATQSSVSMSWSASTDNVGVVGYGVYVNGANAGSSTSTSHSFGGLSCGASYSLAVDAVDAAGNRSAKATVTTSTAPCAAAPAGSIANLWVDGNGGSCTRLVSADGYVDGQACGSFQAAYAAASCGDTVGVVPGTYASQSIASGSKACSSSTPVVFTSVPGASCSDNTIVSMPSFVISVAYVKLECMSANPPTTTSCVNVSGSSGQHGSIIWNTLDHVAMHCAFFDSDHLRVTNSTFGPDNTCQTGMEDLVDFRANTDNINDVVFDHDTFETVTAPPDFECGVGKHVDSMQGYGLSNFTLSNSVFYGCPGQCIIFRPYNGGTPGPFTFYNNFFDQAQDPGQAIDIGSSSSSDGDKCNGPIVIENNTFENGAAVHGGCWNNPTVVIRSNILTSGSCNFGGSSVSYTYNVFYAGTPCGGSARSCVPAYLGSTTTLTVAGNFHLAPADTCAKGAADQTVGNYPATDVDNQPRPQGSSVDAGADEIP
jgi:hypothetical protein